MTWTDGTVLREHSDDRIYVVAGGAKIHFPGPASWERFGEPAPIVVPRGSLERLPDVPRDGTLVRESSSDEIYFINRGRRIRLAPETLEFINFADVRRVPDGSLGFVSVVSGHATSATSLGGAYIGHSPKELAYSVASVAAFADANRAERLEPVIVAAGEVAFFVVKLINTGGVTWYPYGDFPIRLGTWRPQDSPSRFFFTGWVSHNRPADVTEDEVLPGAIGTFTFWVHPPEEPGEWREHFNLVAEHWAWAAGPGVPIAVAVTPAKAANDSDLENQAGKHGEHTPM